MKFKKLNEQEKSVVINTRKQINYDFSNFQKEFQSLIENKFKGFSIIKEFTIPGTKLRIDFYLPSLKMAFEVQGEQHFKFIKYFHGTANKFLKQQENDELKRQWCKLNNITFYHVYKNTDGKLDIELVE